MFLPLAGTLLPNPNGPIRPSTFTGEPDFDRFNQDQWTIGYLFEHHFGDQWTIRQNARYGELKSDFRQVYGTSFLTTDPTTPDSAANFRVLDRYAFGSYEKDSTVTIDNQVQADLGSGRWRNTILVGLDYQRGRFNVTTFFGGAPSLDIYAPVYGQSVTTPDPYIDSMTTLTQAGLYGQLQSKLDDHWVLTLGGRYDWAQVRTDDHLSASTARQSDGKFSGRAGLVYLSPTGLAPYVSYSESFSPITTINPDTSKPFSPETGQQLEGGLRYQPPGRKDSYSVAVFELRRQNFVSFDTSFQPRQTGEVRVKGVEFEALVQPIPDMNVTAAYSWAPKADVTSSSRPTEIGKQMQAVPEHQLSLWTDYRFGFGLKLGAGMRYTGSTRGYGESSPVKVPGYTLFDAMLGYDFGLWRIAINARNLTNKYYFGSNCDSYGCSAGETRRIVGTLTYHW